MADYLPFNSSNHDRVYKADDWAWYFSTFIGNGVFPAPSDALQVTANGDMTVTIKSGKAFINGYAFRIQSDLSVTIETANGSLSRIDRVVVRWSLTERMIYVTVLKGTAAQSPVAAEVTRDAETYDIVLADITVGKGVTGITAANITDQRYDSSLCGIVTGTVDQIDASTLATQLTASFNEWFAGVKDTLSEDAAGNLLKLINNLNDRMGGFSIYPELLTPDDYEALDDETKNTEKMLFIVKKE